MGYKKKLTYPKAPPGKECLSLLETATELSLSYNTVQKMLVSRELKGIKRKGRWIVSRGEIARYLAQAEVETQLGLLRGAI